MSVFAGAEESLHQYSARSSALGATDKEQLVPSSSRPRMNVCQGLGRLIKSERSPKHTTARDCRDMYMERKSKNTRLTWGKNVTSLGYNNCIFFPWQANFSMAKLSLPISHHQKKKLLQRLFAVHVALINSGLGAWKTKKAVRKSCVIMSFQRTFWKLKVWSHLLGNAGQPRHSSALDGVTKSWGWWGRWDSQHQ